MTTVAEHAPAVEAKAADRLSGATLAPSAVGYAAMAVAAGAWSAVVGGLAVWRHEQFLSHRFDLGNMVQAVWSTTQGRPLEMTDGSTGEQIVRLAAHVDPILVLLAPFFWVHPHPETLILLQAVALASGIYPVVRLALKHVGSPIAGALFGAWYLVFPWVVWNAFNDVHPVSFAIPLLLFAIWFLDEHRFLPFTVVAVLALACGELIGLTVAALGVWYAIRYRRPAVGGAIAVGGASWTAICIAFVIPAFNDGRPSRYYERFESVGGSPTGLLEALLFEPTTVLAQVVTNHDLRYVVLLLLPTAFLALAQPLSLLVSVPQLFINTLSEFPSTQSPAYHYVSAVLPGVLVATILGVARLPVRKRVVGAATALVVAILVVAAIPPVPGADSFLFRERESKLRQHALHEAVALVPAGAPVTSTNRLGGHLSTRRAIHLFPHRLGAEWAVLDTQDAMGDAGRITDLGGFQLLLRDLESEVGWNLVFEREGVRVYYREPSSFP